MKDLLYYIYIFYLGNENPSCLLNLKIELFENLKEKFL